MEYLKQIGENIKFYRQSIDMSQDELAEKAGYSGRSAICKIENGQSDLPQSKIVAIAKALHVTVSQLLDEHNKMIEVKFDVELAEAYRNADEKTKHLVAYMLGLKDIMDKEG